MQASKLKKGAWYPCTLRVTMTALERLTPNGSVKWRIRFCDLRQPAIVLLDPAPGQPGGAFRVCGAGDRCPRIYATGSASTLVDAMRSIGAESLGLDISVVSEGGSTGAQQVRRNTSFAGVKNISC